MNQISIFGKSPNIWRLDNVLPNNVITPCLKSQKKLQKEIGFIQTIKYFMSGLSMVHKLTIALMISTFHKSIYAYILVKLGN